MDSRFKLVPLLNKYRIVTNGNTFGSSDTILVDLDIPDVSDLVARSEEITLFTLGESMTANLRWGIFLRSAYSRSFEGDPLQIGGTVGAVNPESKRHAANTDVTKFNLESRLQLGYGNSTGTDLESGIVSAVLGFKLVGM